MRCLVERPILTDLTSTLRAAALSIGVVLACAPAAVAQSVAAKPAPAAAQTLDEVDAKQQVSQTVVDVAGWVIASGDNRGLPFAIVDKNAAQVLIFDAKGKLQGLAPALIGSASGDYSAPGVGDRELSDIPAEDRTTPAGRFMAGYGPAAGGETVLWVDYNTAVSIHPLPKTAVAKKEKREQRLISPMPEDNRITHGCINVSAAFYKKVVSTTFKKKGGVFYVLPDTIPLIEALPAFDPGNRLVAARGSNGEGT